MKQLSFRSIGNSGDNDSVYIHPKTAPPLVSKYKKSRVIGLAIGFIDRKKSYSHCIHRVLLRKENVYQNI